MKEMSEEAYKSHLKKALRNGTKEVLNLIDQQLSEDSSLYNNFLQLWGRYSRLNNQINQNIIDHDAANQEHNRIDKALIELIDQLSIQDFKSSNILPPLTSQNKTTTITKSKNIISDSKLNVKGDFKLGD